MWAVQHSTCVDGVTFHHLSQQHILGFAINYILMKKDICDWWLMKCQTHVVSSI